MNINCAEARNHSNDKPFVSNYIKNVLVATHIAGISYVAYTLFDGEESQTESELACKVFSAACLVGSAINFISKKTANAIAYVSASILFGAYAFNDNVDQNFSCQSLQEKAKRYFSAAMFCYHQANQFEIWKYSQTEIQKYNDQGNYYYQHYLNLNSTIEENCR